MLHEEARLHHRRWDRPQVSWRGLIEVDHDVADVVIGVTEIVDRLGHAVTLSLSTSRLLVEK